MPDLMSKDNVSLRVGDIVSVNMTVAQVFLAVDAVEVVRDAQPIDGASAESPWARALRLGVPMRDCLPPEP